jgi:hypothetical protein
MAVSRAANADIISLEADRSINAVHPIPIDWLREELLPRERDLIREHVASLLSSDQPQVPAFVEALQVTMENLDTVRDMRTASHGHPAHRPGGDTRGIRGTRETRRSPPMSGSFDSIEERVRLATLQRHQRLYAHINGQFPAWSSPPVGLQLVDGVERSDGSISRWGPRSGWLSYHGRERDYFCGLVCEGSRHVAWIECRHRWDSSDAKDGSGSHLMEIFHACDRNGQTDEFT